MRVPALLPTVFIASVAASTLLAQEQRIVRIAPTTVGGVGGRFSVFSDEPRAIIGVSTTSGATARDTLGVLVASVRTGSPAEKAGLEEGNRIASINGISLKLSPADVGDDQMAGVLSRRLSRELDKLKPGDEVDLRIYSSGQTKTVKVKTVAPSELYDSRTFRSADERPTLGIGLAVTGSSRDTLGIFVMSVADSGPAARSGIEEGMRIASINGVDVRGSRSTDQDDLIFRSANVNRFERELAKVKPGDDVDLRVYANGRQRSIKVKAARVSDLPRRNRSITFITSDHAGGSAFPARIAIDGAQIGDDFRHLIEAARVGVRTEMPAITRAFGRVGTRINW